MAQSLRFYEMKGAMMKFGTIYWDVVSDFLNGYISIEVRNDYLIGAMDCHIRGEPVNDMKRVVAEKVRIEVEQ